MGYCFVEFGDQTTASQVLHTLGGKPIPNTNPMKRYLSIYICNMFVILNSDYNLVKFNSFFFLENSLLSCLYSSSFYYLKSNLF